MEAPTTSAPPKQPTANDIGTLQFVYGLELAMNTLYLKAASKVDKDTKPVIEMFGAHHLAYAQSIAGLLGRNAPTEMNKSFFAAFSSAAANGSGKEIAATLLTLENTMMKTHNGVLSVLAGTDGAKLVASIIAVQARHAAVLAGLAGKTDLDSLLDNPAEALSPETYRA